MGRGPGSLISHGVGRTPEITNLGVRDETFSGREEELVTLYSGMRSGRPVVVLGVPGRRGGGIGTSAIVQEYAHRFSGEYDVLWRVPAGSPESIEEALKPLGRALGISDRTLQADVAAAVFATLGRRNRWLLVYDDATDPDEIEWLLPPGGAGRVLVASRWSAWAERADPVFLDVLDRTDAVHCLARGLLQRGYRLTEPDLRLLAGIAALLGYLPGALIEAVAHLASTGTGLGEYRRVLRGRAVGDRGPSSPETLAIDTALDDLQARAPAAAAVLALFSFLADGVPESLLSADPTRTPAPLAEVAVDPALRETVLDLLARWSLVRRDGDVVHVPTAVCSAVRASLAREEERRWACAAATIVRSSFPRQSWEPREWRACAALLPHLLEATGHVERLDAASQDAGWLLDRASSYLRVRGRYGEARPVAERSVAVTVRAMGADHADVARRHDELGRVLRELGDLLGARAEFEEALRVGIPALGADHRDVGTWHGGLGGVLVGLGDHRAALSQLRTALRITQAAFGEEHEAVGVWHDQLGGVLSKLGDYLAARTELEKSLRISVATLGAEHPETAIARGNLGSLMCTLGDFRAARVEMEEATRISVAVLGPEHPATGSHRENLAIVLKNLGERRDARKQATEAHRILRSALGPDHPSTTSCARLVRQLS